MQPRLSLHARAPLAQFELLLTPPGQYAAPPPPAAWREAIACAVPGSVAAALARAGRLDVSAPPDLDAHDAWLRTRLPEALPEGARHLVFEGLATLCDVWLDGAHVLHSENMFRPVELSRTEPLLPGMELTLRCAALAPWLAQKRARPRYRTHLVEAQQLRWLRTSLLGRTPGHAPRLPLVGPYLPVYVEARRRLSLLSHQLRTRVSGSRAELALRLRLSRPEPATRMSATLVLRGAAEGRFPLALREERDGWVAELECVLPKVSWSIILIRADWRSCLEWQKSAVNLA